MIDLLNNEYIRALLILVASAAARGKPMYPLPTTTTFCMIKR